MVWEAHVPTSPCGLLWLQILAPNHQPFSWSVLFTKPSHLVFGRKIKGDFCSSHLNLRARVFKVWKMLIYHLFRQSQLPHSLFSSLLECLFNVSWTFSFYSVSSLSRFLSLMLRVAFWVISSGPMVQCVNFSFNWITVFTPLGFISKVNLFSKINFSQVTFPFFTASYYSLLDFILPPISLIM